MEKKKVWIADFGSQYTQLITRKVRELGYSCRLYSVDEVEDSFKLKTESKILSNTSNPTLDLNNGVKS